MDARVRQEKRKNQVLPVLAFSMLLWVAAAFRGVAQYSSVGFSTPEEAFQFDLLQGAELPYPPYSIAPIVYAEDYVMTGWTWGEMGGVTIAQQRGDSWFIVCGTGGVYDTVESLQEYCGMSYHAAQALLDAWMGADQSSQTAEVFDPPSNVRLTPNGEVLCSVRERTIINIYGQTGDWYYTDVCGLEGVIHSSQIRF